MPRLEFTEDEKEILFTLKDAKQTVTSVYLEKELGHLVTVPLVNLSMAGYIKITAPPAGIFLTDKGNKALDANLTGLWE